MMTKKNADDKRTIILEAAKRRFAHYGMDKTTMAEIASDLSFSKALLYYYYPDKASLYVAVLEYVFEEFSAEAKLCLDRLTNTEAAMMEILDKRMEFIKKYYYIVEYAYNHRMDVPPELEKVYIRVFQVHGQGIKDLLQRGINNGELKPFDVEEYAQIFLYAAMGLRLMVVKNMKIDFIPTTEEFAYIVEMQKKMAKVFLDGLKR